MKNASSVISMHDLMVACKMGIIAFHFRWKNSMKSGANAYFYWVSCKREHGTIDFL